MERERQSELVSSECMSSYVDDYQPTYPDTKRLAEITSELEMTEPVTSPEKIDELKSELAIIAENPGRQIVIAGPCAESVNLADSIEDIADRYKTTVDIINSQLGSPLAISRSRGQSSKPRSSEYETLDDGNQVFSYYGDMINGIESDQRIPDPSRMIAAAVQSRDIETYLSQISGKHIPAAHEALLLPYEESFISGDVSGQQYLLSTDLPWIGERTNDPTSKHVELLSQVENPIGIKLGHSATPEQIAGLVEKLNPDQEPGKLVFMPRLGLDEMDKLPEILRAISDFAPGSLIVCDPMHGNTKKTTTIGGEPAKTRYVSDILEEIKITAAACKDQGLTMHGIHLETNGKDDLEECVDKPGQQPKDKSVVDPQLNNRQLQNVLKELAKL